MQIDSLTPIIVDFYMYEEEVPSESRPVDISKYTLHPDIDSRIFVTSVSYRLGVNTVSEATVGLGFKGKDVIDGKQSGLEKLQEIFPVSGESTMRYTGEIVVKGSSTNYTTIDNDMIVFRGEVQGYGISAGQAELTFNINLKGRFHGLQNLKIGTPGMHGDVTPAVSVLPMSFHQKAQQGGGNNFMLLVRDIVSKASGKKNGFDAFIAIADAYQNTLSEEAGKADTAAFASIQNDNFRVAYRDAIRAYAFGTDSSPFASLKLLHFDRDAIEISDEDLLYNMMHYVIASYMASPQMTFWHLLLAVGETFGLNIVDFGAGVVGFPKAPLLSPTEFSEINYIRKEDLIALQIGDMPYSTPTRCLVTTNATMNTAHTEEGAQWGAKGINFFHGLYPDPDKDLNAEEQAKLQQDEHRGAHILYYKEPTLFASYISTDNAKNNSTTKKKQTSSVKKRISDQPETDENYRGIWQKMQDAADLYAKYIYMSEKFRGRTGIASTRYMPNIFPGLPCTIEDPTRKFQFDCNVLSVHHTLSSSGGHASSTITVNNIRYGKDLVTYPFQNPFYLNFQLSYIESLLTAMTGAHDPWTKWIAKLPGLFERKDTFDGSA